MFLRRIATIGVLILAAASCRGDTNGMPRQWGPLARANNDRCPIVAGRYFASSAPISWVLAGRSVSLDSGTANWAYFELAGSADTAIIATVVTRDSVPHTARLTKGTPIAGDYFCADGWLQLNSRAIPNVWDADIRTAQFYPRRRALRIASGAKHALVARLDFTDYEEFTVWCGDGCKGIPLPWTFKTRSRWSSARPWNADSVALYADGMTDPNDVLPAALQARLSREEQALENGTAVPGQPNMKAFVRSKR